MLHACTPYPILPFAVFALSLILLVYKHLAVSILPKIRNFFDAKMLCIFSHACRYSIFFFGVCVIAFSGYSLKRNCVIALKKTLLSVNSHAAFLG